MQMLRWFTIGSVRFSFIMYLVATMSSFGGAWEGRVSNLLFASVSSSFSHCSSLHQLLVTCPALGGGLHPLHSSQQQSPGCLRPSIQGEVLNSSISELPTLPLVTYIYCPYSFVIRKGFFAHGWLCSIQCQGFCQHIVNYKRTLSGGLFKLQLWFSLAHTELGSSFSCRCLGISNVPMCIGRNFFVTCACTLVLQISSW